MPERSRDNVLRWLAADDQQEHALNEIADATNALTLDDGSSSSSSSSSNNKMTTKIQGSGQMHLHDLQIESKNSKAVISSDLEYEDQDSDYQSTDSLPRPSSSPLFDLPGPSSSPSCSAMDLEDDVDSEVLQQNSCVAGNANTTESETHCHQDTGFEYHTVYDNPHNSIHEMDVDPQVVGSGRQRRYRQRKRSSRQRVSYSTSQPGVRQGSTVMACPLIHQEIGTTGSRSCDGVQRRSLDWDLVP